MELIDGPALCRILVEGRAVVALRLPAGIVPLALADPLLALRDGALDPAVVADAEGRHAEALAEDDVVFLPPVEPRTMLYVGRNYEDHLAENPRPRGPTPVFFSKLVSSLVAHGDPIRVRDGQHADYEGELAFVIGRVAQRVSRADALSVVAGYTIANDVSDRAVQHVNHQITMGKGPDTFGPLGPWLVPAATIGDGSGRRLRTWVGDELRQDASTSELIHDVAACIEAATATVTLQPGDVIATGTPAGVGAYHEPPVWLRPGDTVTVEVEGLGRLVNPVIAAD